SRCPLLSLTSSLRLPLVLLRHTVPPLIPTPYSMHLRKNIYLIAKLESQLPICQSLLLIYRSHLNIKERTSNQSN
ncbi:hypothetical protein, partial [Oenococcus oeni]|uniref:hypothetical protein n=1 Tax=Oenococcus oeni TaxID=1247 RepID=UPI00214AD7D7